MRFEELRSRLLSEAEDALRAIRSGQVDAVIVENDDGEQVYTRRGAEEPYRHLVEQMREGAAILTNGGEILYCNQRFAEMIGVASDAASGRHFDRFIADEDKPAVAALFADGTGHQRCRLIAAHGRTLEAHLSLTTSIEDGADQRNVIVSDLSELVDAQAGRNRAEEESHAKDEFMAMLAHELRNPLSAISSAATVIDASVDPRSARQAREVIRRQVDHLSRLVDDLLDVRRVITGRIVLDRQPLDLADVVRRVATTFDGAASLDRRLDVRTSPAWVDGDPVRLEQVVANVVSNAIKYTPGGGHINVIVEPEGADVALTITDDGVGIGAELLSRVFDLFVQGDRTIDRSQGGLGIGLTLVKRLVELHGGTVTASSTGQGQGSTFTIRLPRVDSRERQSVVETAPEPVRPRRVLIIEDNPDVREMLRLMLELSGHVVASAANGMEGLAIVEVDPIDVAIIDLGLPQLDGYRVARLIRANPRTRHLPLLALSGYGLPHDRERSKRAGFDHHLVKPVPAETLQDLIATTTNGRSH